MKLNADECHSAAYASIAREESPAAAKRVSILVDPPWMARKRNTSDVHWPIRHVTRCRLIWKRKQSC